MPPITILQIAILLGLCLALAVTERGPERLLVAVPAMAAVVGFMLLLVGDIERAGMLAIIAMLAIGAASQMKHYYSGMKLAVADLSLLFAGTLPFLLTQYRRAALACAATAAVLGCASVLVIVLGAGEPLPFATRGTLFAIAIALFAGAFRLSGGAEALRGSIRQRRGYFSTFMASLADVASWWPSRGLVLIDAASAERLVLMPATRGRVWQWPDIILIQHESVFDPRRFGLAVEPEVAAFLSPQHGLCGALNVDIFGGGSWQSEFSLFTGLSSASFGHDAYFMLQRGIGRFHHTLPRTLAAQGYKTMLVSSCRRRFLHYDAFYRSMGVDERIFSDDLPRPFNVDRFEKTYSDCLFLDAVREIHRQRIEADPAPRFTCALTNFNHGPHDLKRAAPQPSEPQRAFAWTQLPDPHYVEFYARLAETAAAWQRTKAVLASQSARPTLIVHYGDHQPVLTRAIEAKLGLPDDDRRLFRTFYAIEALNFELDRSAATAPPLLDIALLGTLSMQVAGLPLDSVSATRASLMADCGEGYFASPSERKHRFHRTLIDMRLIDLSPRVRTSPRGPKQPGA